MAVIKEVYMDSSGVLLLDFAGLVIWTKKI